MNSSQLNFLNRYEKRKYFDVGENGIPVSKISKRLISGISGILLKDESPEVKERFACLFAIQNTDARYITALIPETVKTITSVTRLSELPENEQIAVKEATGRDFAFLAFKAGKIIERKSSSPDQKRFASFFYNPKASKNLGAFLHLPEDADNIFIVNGSIVVVALYGYDNIQNYDNRFGKGYDAGPEARPEQDVSDGEWQDYHPFQDYIADDEDFDDASYQPEEVSCSVPESDVLERPGSGETGDAAERDEERSADSSFGHNESSGEFQFNLTEDDVNDRVRASDNGNNGRDSDWSENSETREDSEDHSDIDAKSGCIFPFGKNGAGDSKNAADSEKSSDAERSFNSESSYGTENIYESEISRISESSESSEASEASEASGASESSESSGASESSESSESQVKSEDNTQKNTAHDQDDSWWKGCLTALLILLALLLLIALIYWLLCLYVWKTDPTYIFIHPQHRETVVVEQDGNSLPAQVNADGNYAVPDTQEGRPNKTEQSGIVSSHHTVMESPEAALADHTERAGSGYSDSVVSHASDVNRTGNRDTSVRDGGVQSNTGYSGNSSDYSRSENAGSFSDYSVFRESENSRQSGNISRDSDNVTQDSDFRKDVRNDEIGRQVSSLNDAAVTDSRQNAADNRMVGTSQDGSSATSLDEQNKPNNSLNTDSVQNSDTGSYSSKDYSGAENSDSSADHPFGRELNQELQERNTENSSEKQGQDTGVRGNAGTDIERPVTDKPQSLPLHQGLGVFDWHVTARGQTADGKTGVDFRLTSRDNRISCNSRGKLTRNEALKADEYEVHKVLIGQGCSSFDLDYMPEKITCYDKDAPFCQIKSFSESKARSGKEDNVYLLYPYLKMTKE